MELVAGIEDAENEGALVFHAGTAVRGPRAVRREPSVLRHRRAMQPGAAGAGGYRACVHDGGAAGDGREFLIPNEDLVTQKVVNWTYTDKNTLVKVLFSTNYDADPRLVCKLAIENAAAAPRAIKNKPPNCILTEFAEAGIPFIFDPGQAMPLFNGAELRDFIELADYVTVNDYESNLLQERTGWNEKDIVSRVKAYICTRGPKGAEIHTAKENFDVPPAHERRVTDPAGCGDAFRAGLIFGIEKGYDWMTIGRIGNLMGALKVEHPGTQNQRFDYDELPGWPGYSGVG